MCLAGLGVRQRIVWTFSAEAVESGGRRGLFCRAVPSSSFERGVLISACGRLRPACIVPHRILPGTPDPRTGSDEADGLVS